jgi:hypothetical protein
MTAGRDAITGGSNSGYAENNPVSFLLAFGRHREPHSGMCAGMFDARGNRDQAFIHHEWRRDHAEGCKCCEQQEHQRGDIHLSCSPFEFHLFIEIFPWPSRLETTRKGVLYRALGLPLRAALQAR